MLILYQVCSSTGGSPIIATWCSSAMSTPRDDLQTSRKRCSCALLPLYQYLVPGPWYEYIYRLVRVMCTYQNFLESFRDTRYLFVHTGTQKHKQINSATREVSGGLSTAGHFPAALSSLVTAPQNEVSLSPPPPPSLYTRT